MKTFKFITLIIINLHLASCSEKLFEEKPVQATDKVVVEEVRLKSLSRDNVKIEYTPTNRPNIYNVGLSWPKFEGEIRIKDSEKKYIPTENEDMNTFVLPGLEGGVERLYYLETFKPESNLYSEIELKIMPPKDLVLSGEIILKENTTFIAETIFIADDTKIHNNVYNLEIIFSKLILGKNVVISPYPINQKAALDTIGRDGGNIKIQGEQAFGNLYVYMNSEAGGDGSTGGISCRSGWVVSMCEGYLGKNSGKIGTAVIEIDNSNDLILTSQILKMAGGSAGAKFPGVGKDAARFCGDNPHHVIDPKICNVAPISGFAATGGKICFKSSSESQYECKQ